MVLLLNTLSTTNASGRSVVAGHFSRLAAWAGPEHRFVGLYHVENADLRQLLPDRIQWRRCPDWTRHWFGRTLWERAVLGRLAHRLAADVVFMMSGTVVETCRVPQASLAMNPWCLVPAAWTSTRERLKAGLQRRAYRSAVHRASLMAYLSRFLREAYVANAGGYRERACVIAPAALHEDILTAAQPDSARCCHEPGRIVTVSLMAPHKGVETVLDAFALVRARVPGLAELHLVGGWPNRAYEMAMRARIAELGIGSSVTVHGFVSRQELLEQYARASVFCLMSWCESFGIPALEAQCFGTPVVSSNCCAIPEVCGEGGLYPAPGDADGTAGALARVLTDPETWGRLSVAARANALRYTYDQTARPLMRVFDLAARPKAE